MGSLSCGTGTRPCDAGRRGTRRVPVLTVVMVVVDRVPSHIVSELLACTARASSARIIDRAGGAYCYSCRSPTALATTNIWLYGNMIGQCQTEAIHGSATWSTLIVWALYSPGATNWIAARRLSRPGFYKGSLYSANRVNRNQVYSFLDRDGSDELLSS